MNLPNWPKVAESLQLTISNGSSFPHRWSAWLPLSTNRRLSLTCGCYSYRPLTAQRDQKKKKMRRQRKPSVGLWPQPWPAPPHRKKKGGEKNIVENRTPNRSICTFSFAPTLAYLPRDPCGFRFVRVSFFSTRPASPTVSRLAFHSYLSALP